MTNDSIVTNAPGITAVVNLAAAYDAYVAANNGDDSGFFGSGANAAVIMASDGSGRDYNISLGPDGSSAQDEQHGSDTAMVTNRVQLGETLAVHNSIMGLEGNEASISTGYANLISGDGQYVLELAVQPN